MLNRVADGLEADAEYVAEMQACCTPMHAMRCEPAPPLALEPEFFDLVWAISVFTVLDEAGADPPRVRELAELAVDAPAPSWGRPGTSIALVPSPP